MRENDFRTYLENAETITSKQKAVNSRVSRANTVEELLGSDLDYVVADDNRMYEALRTLTASPKEGNGRLQNALRWYYRFANGRHFPSITAYKKQPLPPNEIL